MKKTTFIFLIAILCVSTGFAQRLGMSEAQEKAEAFLLSKGVKSELTHLTEHENMRKAKGVNGNLQPSYYVFSCEEGSGFVIVASEECNQPILAYSEAGAFTLNEMPMQLQALLNDYELAVQMGINAAPTAAAKNRIEPLVTAQWDQDRDPYNTYCPMVDYVRAAAGCVPVAMAQVMNYHKWPNEIKAEIPARDKYNLTAVPAGTKIDWNNMLDIYGASYTPKQAEAVGRLMLYCGQSLPSTVYHAGTGASMPDVEIALRDIFNYDDDVQYVKRSSYTISQWSDLIYNELAAGRPVVMSGATGDGSGHAFVCDGYDGEGFFHINWGWSGFVGYYSLELLAPRLEEGFEHMFDGEAYSFEREAIIGIHTPDGIATVRKDDRRLTTDNIIIDGTALYPSMLTGTVNESFDFEYGFGVLGADGSIAPIITREHRDMYYGFSATILADRKFDLAGRFTSAGVYKVIPISRIMGSETWFRNTPGNIYVEVVVSAGGNITSMQLKEEKVELEITELKILGSLIAYTPHVVEATIKNIGSEFCGTLYMNAGWGLSSATAVSLVAGGSGKFYFPVEMPSAGNYTAKIYTDENYSNSIGSLDFSIKDLIYSVANLTISHDLGAVVEGDGTAFNIIAKNNGDKYLNAIRLEIRCDGQFFDVQEFYIEIESGATASIPVKLSALSEGKMYHATIYYYSNNSSVKATEFSFTCTREAETSIDDVESGAENGVYYDLGGRRVENPVRGIYIVNGKKVLVR